MNIENARHGIYMAQGASAYSTCHKRRIGAVIVNKAQIVVGEGYGGSVNDTPVEGEWCEGCGNHKGNFTYDKCWSIHAEMRAIFDMYDKCHKEQIETWSITRELVLYSTHGPCDQCMKLIEFRSIPRVVFANEHETNYSKWAGKVEVFHFDGRRLRLTNP